MGQPVAEHPHADAGAALFGRRSARGHQPLGRARNRAAVRSRGRAVDRAARAGHGAERPAPARRDLRARGIHAGAWRRSLSRRAVRGRADDRDRPRGDPTGDRRPRPGDGATRASPRAVQAGSHPEPPGESQHDVGVPSG